MWIRSQDKEKLIDTKFLYIEENLEFVEVENGILARKMVGYAILSQDIKLGIYSTKEKALKVLDMMEHFRNVVDANKLTFHMPNDDGVE